MLGLEFFLAGDVIQTIVVPTWETLGTLGGIVVIRTVIVYPEPGAEPGPETSGVKHHPRP